MILSASVGSKPVEVLFDIDPDLPRPLLGDAMRLQQVLINLGGNAVKFTAEGEVVVSVRALARDADAQTLGFAVRDTGIGIAPENQARIFSGFTQAEASTTRRFGGTGLGVAISQRLVALMGGELQLDSAVGHGSSFHFTLRLPLASVAAAGVAADTDTDTDTDIDLATPDQPAAAPPGLRMLVVDDNPTARQVLQAMGQGLGWAVDTASDGAAALAQLAAAQAQGWQHDAVFIDWQMPGLDGWQTAQRIRGDGLAVGAPLLVMVTAHGREKFEARSASDQALLDGFLVKPVTASMLRDAVADARCGQGQPQQCAPARPATAGQPARLHGLRLLVVEDNANNQQVARELLEDEGASVQIAGNGQQGVDAVAAAVPCFDVVLMDLQMPVMDGFAATARIRQHLGLDQDALPIVAMTANAMASDREACLAAGMNEHIGKPFDLDRLVALLLRLRRRPAAGAALALPDHGPAPGVNLAPAAVLAAAAGPGLASPAAPALPAALAAAAAVAQVDLVAALGRLGGKQPVYARLLRGFIGDLQALPAALALQLDGGDLVAAARSLHTLKGLAATLGALALSACAAQAEQRLAAGPGLDRAEVHAALQQAVRAATPALNALLVQLESAVAATAAAAVAAPAAAATPATKPSATADPGWPARPPHAATPVLLHATLTRLAALLAESDMQATEVVATLQQQAAGRAWPDLAALDDAVAGLDFERAAALCQRLILEICHADA